MGNKNKLMTENIDSRVIYEMVACSGYLLVDEQTIENRMTKDFSKAFHIKDMTIFSEVRRV